MTIDTIRVRTESPTEPRPDAPAEAPDLPSERVVDVTDVSAARVEAYCREAGEAYLTHRGGRTFLVVQ